jgi:DNA-binding winged helix-turn-helix (wHTH) protein/tetratricopeptide (TPR) repeat protein
MEPNLDPDSVLCFGIFEADLGAGELRKGGVRVKIQDSPFRALRLFLLHPRQVLTRQDFRKALWPDDVFVDFDRGINTTINRLRETLGDVSSNPVFIETVARSGYRWIAPVEVVPRDGEVLHQADAPISGITIEEGPNLTSSWSKLSTLWRWQLWLAATLVIASIVTLLVFRWKRVHGTLPVPPQAASATQTSNPPATARAAKASSDPQAERFYLDGRYYWNKRTPEGLRRAVDLFTQAIVRDPGYANAYVGLADTFNLMREFADMPDAEAYPRAYSAAKKAAELDDSSAEAHATLGFLSFWWKRDVAAADREFQRALMLNPSYVDAYHWYGNVLGCVGRTVEGLRYLDRAQQLNPGAVSIRADKAGALLLAGDHKQGVAQLKEIEATDSGFASPHLYLAQYYLSELDGRNYLAEMRVTSQLRARPDDLLVQRAAEKGFAAGGTIGMLQSMLAAQTKLYDEGRLSAFQMARTEALLGDRTAALSYLRTSLHRNESDVAILRVDLALKGLHSMPEFQQLVADAGLPPLS